VVAVSGGVCRLLIRGETEADLLGRDMELDAALDGKRDGKLDTRLDTLPDRKLDTKIDRKLDRKSDPALTAGADGVLGRAHSGPQPGG
jgi:hypothetical protein